jgi:hypothetical protein
LLLLLLGGLCHGLLTLSLGPQPGPLTWIGRSAAPFLLLSLCLLDLLCLDRGIRTLFLGFLSEADFSCPNRAWTKLDYVVSKAAQAGRVLSNLLEHHCTDDYGQELEDSEVEDEKNDEH